MRQENKFLRNQFDKSHWVRNDTREWKRNENEWKLGIWNDRDDYENDYC